MPRSCYFFFCFHGSRATVFLFLQHTQRRKEREFKKFGDDKTKPSFGCFFLFLSPRVVHGVPFFQNMGRERESTSGKEIHIMRGNSMAEEKIKTNKKKTKIFFLGPK